MSASIVPRSLSRRQLGAASVGITMLIMFILVAAVTAVLNMSGSSVIDAAKNEEQVAALFLAESGVQRAQAAINAAALSGTYTDTTCTDLGTVTGALGRGNFSYTASSEPALCGGSNPACTSCTINTTGTIGASTRRTVRTVITSTLADGVAGCGDNFSLVLPIPSALTGSAAVFTHIAWRARPISGVCSGGDNNNASVASCSITGGGSCDFNKGWKLERTGTNNASSVGVFGTPPTGAGNYTINFALQGSTGAATRSFASTGVVLFPLVGASPVNYVGSYGLDNKTSSTSGLDGVVPTDWTCGAANATPNIMSQAAGADTLFYGLSALGVTAGNETTSLVFGIQPMWRVSSLTGGNGDYLYSQSWITYNPSYWPVAGATNGANFTGSIGATFTGSIAGTTLTVTTPPADGILSIGDTITCLGGGPCTITANTTIQSGPVVVAGLNTYTLSQTSTVAGHSMSAASTVLNVSAITAPTYAVLTPGAIGTGDTIDVTGTPTVLSQTSGTTGGQGLYTISGPQLTVARNARQSSGRTITLPTGGTAPSPGTALGVPSGTGAFASISITGGITGNALTVSGVGTPAVGDALYGSSVQPGTRITAGTYPNYTVTPSQTVPSGSSILARAAIRGVDSGAPAPTDTSFVSSSVPTTRLSSSAQLCGGVCPFLFPFTGSGSNSGTHFTITGLTSGRDWASGFACLNNVNPFNIRHLSRVIASQSSWSEPVR